MKRFDLRRLKTEFIPRMLEILSNDINGGESAIFLFEVSDFALVQQSADAVKIGGFELLNSLKFNEVDWTLVVRKSK